MPAPVVRPIGPDEVDLFTSFTDASPLGLKPPLAMHLDGLHEWYRPEWSWVALRDGQVVARVAFSGPPEAKLPLVMGSLEIGTRPDRIATGLALVRTACGAMTGGGTGEDGRPEYRQFLPVDWHQHDGMRAAVAEVVAVVRGTLDGTLDAHARRDVAGDGVDAARAVVEELPGPRSLMRLAYDPAGRCVGITVPGLRPWGADVSYVGVLPGHRGNGYADDLLLEAGHLLVEGGATEIVAATDVGNTPMAAAFARCGYLVTDG